MTPQEAVMIGYDLQHNRGFMEALELKAILTYLRI
jgi:hypothetical protein